MAVLPENMDRIDAQNSEESIKTMDAYIRYMCERIEFNNSSLTKVMNSSEISATQLYIMLVALQNTVSTIASTVNQMQGSINTINNTIGTIQSNITTIQGDISTINENIATINSTLTDHEQRISALEGE